MSSPIHTIGVCGGGTMGRGIAQLTARAGFSTLLYELHPGALEKAKRELDAELLALTSRGRMNKDEMEAILSRIRFTGNIDECRADLFIEAIIERQEEKAALFGQLISRNNRECILATNTSSLSVTELAKKIQWPQQLIGMHFFNPAPLMKLVEIVTTPFTSPEVTSTISSLAAILGKTAVLCRDSPGFIVNRVARPFYLESLRIAETMGTDTAFSTIDGLLEATGFRMGPFKLMDLIGNDINYAVTCSVYEQLQQPARLMPSYLQKERVENGALGRKTGKGYYQYD